MDEVILGDTQSSRKASINVKSWSNLSIRNDFTPQADISPFLVHIDSSAKITRVQSEWHDICGPVISFNYFFFTQSGNRDISPHRNFGMRKDRIVGFFPLPLVKNPGPLLSFVMAAV